MPGYDPDEPCMPLSAVVWPPGGPPLIDPQWRTPTVLALARDIAESGANEILPILADALEDAGCDNQYVLNHCRKCAVHIPMCWVTSAVLQNPARPKPQTKTQPPSGRFRAISVSKPGLGGRAPRSVRAIRRERWLNLGCNWACCFGPFFLMALLLAIVVVQVVLELLGLREPPGVKPPIPVREYRWPDYRPSPTFR